MKKIMIVVLMIFLAFNLSACKKEVQNYTSNNSNGNIETDDKKQTDEYEAKVYFDGDHYVLNVFTNLIEDDFKFSYDATSFVLNDTSKVFEKAKITTKDNYKSYSIKLESNTLYEFEFIQLKDEELSLGKNLIIE